MGMDRIVVTGGSGKAGRAVVADLTAAGHEVLSVDIAASLDPDEPTLAVDLTDLGDILDELEPILARKEQEAADA